MKELKLSMNAMQILEARYLRRDMIYNRPTVHKMPLELEPEEEQAVHHKGECELNGKLLAGGSVICERGECGVCFKGKWLHSDDLH